MSHWHKPNEISVIEVATMRNGSVANSRPGSAGPGLVLPSALCCGCAVGVVDDHNTRKGIGGGSAADSIGGIREDAGEQG